MAASASRPLSRSIIIDYAHVPAAVIFNIFDLDLKGESALTLEMKGLKLRLKEIFQHSMNELDQLYVVIDKCIPASFATSLSPEQNRHEEIKYEVLINAFESGFVKIEDLRDLESIGMIRDNIFTVCQEAFEIPDKADVSNRFSKKVRVVTYGKILDDLQVLNAYIYELECALKSLSQSNISLENRTSLETILTKLALGEKHREVFDEFDRSIVSIGKLREQFLIPYKEYRDKMGAKLQQLNCHPLQRARDHKLAHQRLFGQFAKVVSEVTKPPSESALSASGSSSGSAESGPALAVAPQTSAIGSILSGVTQYVTGTAQSALAKVARHLASEATDKYSLRAPNEVYQRAIDALTTKK